MPARCQARPTLPAFLPNLTKGALRASSAGSAAPCAASSPAASLSPAACDARPRRNPAAPLPRPETWRRRPRPGGRARRPGRAPPPVPPPRPARPGWLARWFGRNRRQPALLGRPPFPDSDDAPFTPQAYPGLSPEACAILNTPVEDCDPEILRLLLAVLARHIADSMRPELGLDAETLFSTLCDRLGTVPGDSRAGCRAGRGAAPSAGHTDGCSAGRAARVADPADPGTSDSTGG